MTRTSSLISLFRRAFLAGGASALLLTGCSGLIGPSGPPPQIYVLQPDMHALSDAPMTSWQLVVSEPGAAESLDTVRIALMRGQIMDYYANAQWTDSLPHVVQDRLVETFEKSGKIAAVAGTSDGVRADYVLETDLRHFEARYDSENGAPTIVVDIVARLLTVERRNVIATFYSHHEAPAAKNDIPSVVSAFDSAAGASFEEIAAWTLRQREVEPSAPMSPQPAKRSRHHH